MEPTQIDTKAEPFRAALDKAMLAYTKGHYPDGVVTVSHTHKLKSVYTCT